MRNNE